MHPLRRTAVLLTAAAAGTLLAACGASTSAASAPAGTTAAPHRTSVATADPATAARHAEFTTIQAEMAHAMTAAGLSSAVTENIHPSGSLTSVKYCLNSFLLLVPAAQADRVAGQLKTSMTAAGWTADPTAAAGSVVLNRGDWVLTVTHHTSGTDVDPATGKVRTGPMSFFQAKNTSFDCT